MNTLHTIPFRLAALKRSGEEEWKKKITRQKNDDFKFGNNQNRDSNNSNSDAVENNKNVESDKNEANANADNVNDAPTLRRPKSSVTSRTLAPAGDPSSARPVSLVERLSQVLENALIMAYLHIDAFEIIVYLHIWKLTNANT